WESVSTVAPAADGTVHLTAKPTVTTDYRLATSADAIGYVRVKVAPAVTVTSWTSTLVAGSEQPLLPRAPVTIQQQSADMRWSTVATGTVGAAGTWSIPVQLAAGGTFRVVVTPGAGYAPATTAPQIVAG